MLVEIEDTQEDKKRQIFRNLEIPSDSQSADLTDEELNRILRLLINNRKAEPVAEELRRIGGGRRSYGRGSSGGKTEGQTVGYYYGPYGYYGSPWWAGYGRWGYYVKPS